MLLRGRLWLGERRRGASFRGQYEAWDSLGESEGGDVAYEDEGPGNIVFFFMKVVNEEDENAGDDDGGEKLAQSQEVEGEGRV